VLNDPRVALAHYVSVQLRVRWARVRSGELDRGALSLEWVAIAFVLVTAAVALAAFLTGKIGDFENQIPSSP
jgi:hypothetical protein